MADLFLDTSHALALVSKRDQHHRAARRVQAGVEARRDRIVTTRGVLLEFGNALHRPEERAVCVRFLDRVRTDPAVDIVDVDASLYERALDLYRSRPDKEWGLVDCASFVVMRERGLTDALTADRHFEQAGFRSLLLDLV